MKKISYLLLTSFLVSSCAVNDIDVKEEIKTTPSVESKNVNQQNTTNIKTPITNNTIKNEVKETPKKQEIISVKDKEINIAQNYNIETILVGLKKEKDHDKALEILAKQGLKEENFMKGINVISVSSAGKNVPELLKKLSSEKFFSFVETDNLSQNKPEADSEVEDSIFNVFGIQSFNDKYFKDQYSIKSLKLEDAWNISTGKNTTIAIIDSGVDFNHADLKNKLVPGYDAFAKKEGEKGGNVSKLNYLFSVYKHGSHVAGIAAAEANNSKGIVGVAPDAKIMPIKIFPGLPEMFKTAQKNPDGSDVTVVSAIADGIVWAVDHKADVINMSLGVWEPSITLETAVKYALDHNVSVVVAAGNDRADGNKRNYLAAINGVIGVGATDQNDKITFFSNSGDYVSVAAPGYDIISTTPSILKLKEYRKMSGTSMASPEVAGVVALLKSKYGEKATPSWVKERLQKTATDLGEPGRDDLYGNGLVNALKALSDE
ncbi:MAG: S8 family serine peptidase [Candidatus Sericytochromatia bacterium]